MKNAAVLIASLGLVAGAVVLLLKGGAPDEAPQDAGSHQGADDGTPAANKITVAASQGSGSADDPAAAIVKPGTIPQVLDPAGSGAKSPAQPGLPVPPPPEEPANKGPELPPELQQALTVEIENKFGECVANAELGARADGVSAKMTVAATLAEGKLSVTPVVVALDGATPAALDALSACGKTATDAIDLEASGHADVSGVAVNISVDAS